ncbi:MAG: rane protein [Alphaproteobacteria bacterium]|nr:rane protein [Alphaproteobacteria bacterium]MDB5720189.1 rane protein [Alphaproteobacteria bacterium]
MLRAFVIKNRFEAWAVIYALALGASSRGFHYHETYPGIGGWLLFTACTGAVFMAGAKILDATRPPTYRRSSLRRIVGRARLS